MERLRGMYEHSELVLFLQGPNQTAALNKRYFSCSRLFRESPKLGCKTL